MTLTGAEFLRRYEQHILPRRFCKIRHYGYLGNYKRKQRVNELLQQMNLPEPATQILVSSTIRMIEKYGVDGLLCSSCKKAKLELLYVVDISGKKEVQRENRRIMVKREWYFLNVDGRKGRGTPVSRKSKQ